MMEANLFAEMTSSRSYVCKNVDACWDDVSERIELKFPEKLFFLLYLVFIKGLVRHRHRP